MPKVEPSIKNLALQPLRSLVSDQAIDPPQWVEEFEKQSYSPQEILTVIEFYEFIISCLVKIFSFFLTMDEGLKERVNVIYSKRLHNFMEIYFQGKVVDYEDFLYLVQAINIGSNEKYLKFGVLGDPFSTKRLYHSLNKYSSACFTDSQTKKRNLHKLIIQSKREIFNHYDDIFTNSKGIVFPLLDFQKIQNLLAYFERKKAALSFDNQNSLIAYKADSGMTNYSLLERVINIFFIKNENNTYDTDIDEFANLLEEHTEKINETVISDGDKTRDLIIAKSMEITGEILKYYDFLPDEVKELSPQKLWMLARHKELIPVIKILVKNGIIKEHPDHYELVKIGKNFLAYLLWDICKLEKYKTKRTSEYTDAVFEPFNIGFGQTKLEDSARKQLNPPERYEDFIKKCGIPSDTENSI